jgi:hypothetical protein
LEIEVEREQKLKMANVIWCGKREMGNAAEEGEGGGGMSIRQLRQSVKVNYLV